MSSLTLLSGTSVTNYSPRVKAGAAPRLENLWLTRNQIGDEGCKALAAALKEGAAPSLKARDAPPSPHALSPAQCSYPPSPRVQELRVDNYEQPELVAVCEERGISDGSIGGAPPGASPQGSPLLRDFRKPTISTNNLSLTFVSHLSVKAVMVTHFAAR